MSHSSLDEFPLTRQALRNRTCFTQAIKRKRRMRQLAMLLLVIAPACRFGGGDGADPPPDAVVVANIDAPDTTAPSADAASMPCVPGTDTDKDSLDDCTEKGDSDPFTDPAKFNGLHALIGDSPFTGNCDQLSDYG